MAELSEQERKDLENELALLLILMWQSQSNDHWYRNSYTRKDFRKMLEDRGVRDTVRKVITKSEKRFIKEVGRKDSVLDDKTIESQVDDYVDALADRMKNRLKDFKDKFRAEEKVRKASPDDYKPKEISPYTDADAAVESATSVTDLQSSTEDTAAFQFQAIEEKKIHAFWFTEPGSCDVCSPLQGKGKEFWGKKFPKGPPAHPNCVLPDTKISSLIGFDGAACAHYRGNVVKVITEDGRVLMTTENHIYPTNRGLVAACQMKPRDLLWGVSNDAEYATELAGDVFEKFRKIPRAMVWNGPIDESSLHGDGRSVVGNACVISLNARVPQIDDDQKMLEHFIENEFDMAQVLQVTDVDVLWYEGHVFDFSGVTLPYYVANGIIVHNCRCHLEWLPVLD